MGKQLTKEDRGSEVDSSCCCSFSFSSFSSAQAQVRRDIHRRTKKLTDFVMLRGHRSQQEMCDHFLPIIKERGQIRRKTARCMARPARVGELVVTIEGGRTTAEIEVEDEQSLVVKALTGDREEYVLDRNTFELNYESEGSDLDISQAGNEYLDRQGFRLYKSKRHIWVYQVAEEDLKFVSSGFFRASYSSTLVPLSAGDYLATGHPDEMATDVYMIPAFVLAQTYSPLPEDRSQEFMRRHFLPIIKERGTVRRKAVGCMARPAVRGETITTLEANVVTTKYVVDDDHSIVIKALTKDREEYVTNRSTFATNYEAESQELDTQQPGNLYLSERGFRTHKSKRSIWAYCVTDEDMKSVPTGLFWASYGVAPVPLKPGDYLATGYPDELSTDVYMIPAVTLAQTYEALPEDRSQAFMCDHFITAIMERGVVMRKIVGCMARPAVVGERVISVEGGNIVSESQVQNAEQMVLKALTGDREEYTLDKPTFELNYDTEGSALDNEQTGNEYLAAKGFQLYKSKRRIWAYAVTASDLDLLPTGFFWSTFGNAPVQLRQGDYLVTGYPKEHASEVYMIHSHVLQQTYAPAEEKVAVAKLSWYQSGVLSARVPSQEELLQRLGPVLLERGRRYRKMKRAFLRPAKEGEVLETIFDGKIETTNTAKKGDWIVRADTSHKERYILTPEKFAAAYDPNSGCAVSGVEDAEALTAEGFKAYVSRARIVAMAMTAEDLVRYFPSGNFMAAWGQPMLVEESDFVAGVPCSASLQDGFKEIYRIEKTAFGQTYALDYAS
eukprot:gb/GFBE01049329.1/.p1 GENE.gb/GFBE01049329.1/~~gb/GFBE01049329.1/.p1  ORF type:complete len:784 (+),score=158.80 gb/GFBE01049329.1/:1-2352(+)